MLVDRFNKLENKTNVRVRAIEFALYNASTNDFKKIKKPSDLYPLPGDSDNKALDGKEGQDALMAAGLVETK